MPSLRRRRFDHFAIELSLALERAVPRFALFRAVAPHLESGAVLAEFCGAPLDAFLADQELPGLSSRALVRLRRSVGAFDPSRRTPEEVLGRLFGGGGAAV